MRQLESDNSNMPIPPMKRKPNLWKHDAVERITEWRLHLRNAAGTTPWHKGSSENQDRRDRNLYSIILIEGQCGNLPFITYLLQRLTYIPISFNK